MVGCRDDVSLRATSSIHSGEPAKSVQWGRHGGKSTSYIVRQNNRLTLEAVACRSTGWLDTSRIQTHNNFREHSFRLFFSGDVLILSENIWLRLKERFGLLHRGCFFDCFGRHVCLFFLGVFFLCLVAGAIFVFVIRALVVQCLEITLRI